MKQQIGTENVCCYRRTFLIGGCLLSGFLFSRICNFHELSGVRLRMTSGVYEGLRDGLLAGRLSVQCVIVICVGLGRGGMRGETLGFAGGGGGEE